MKPFSRLVLGFLGALAFLAPLKFGTPVPVQSMVFPPTGLLEWVFFAWPYEWAVIAGVLILGWVGLDKNRPAARVDALFLLPLAFLITQLAAMPGSINPQGSVDTVVHFAFCMLVFYAGAWYVRDGADAVRIFSWLGLATFLVCVYAAEQYFGGLADTRRLASLYVDPSRIPPDLALKLTSTRVFGTLVSPNTLAGYLALTFVPVLAWIWVRGRGWDVRVKWITLVCAAALMIECLMLTGSRGGLIAFGVGLLSAMWCLLQNRLGRAMFWVGMILAVLGLTFFVARRAGVLRLSTTSLGARADYVSGAVGIVRDHAWRGTGPGTFGSIYPKYKTDDSNEEPRMVHNDYLQMWSDSGLPAMIVYIALWAVAILHGFRLTRDRRGDAAAVAVCAALTAWAVHGLVDFDLYVPGAAVPAFLLLGILQGLKNAAAPEPVALRGPARWVAGGCCACVIAGLVWVESRNLLAEYAYERAELRRQGEPVGALAEARRAVAWVPWNSHFQSAAGDLAVDLGRFSEAAMHYEAAIRWDRFRASYHWRLARAELAVHGVNDLVLQHLRMAVDLNPHQPCRRPDEPCYRRDLALALAKARLKESVRQSHPVLIQSPVDGPK